MRGLAYKARTILEETGANNLYLALGSLVWELNGRSLRSPLVLVPVTLKAAARAGRYRLALDETVRRRRTTASSRSCVRRTRWISPASRSRSPTALATFDEYAHERAIGRFVGTSSAVRAHLTTVVPQQILRSRDFNPAATGGQVGLLQRQLNAKRGGMKVRELMTTFGDLITRALPCVLVSPDSLARFFPAIPGLFDIVVFDEASQVRVADAIGAMGRARSVVVVGDSMQMPPTSFAESSFAVDEPDAAGTGDVVEDEESILSECVQARVQRHRLTWHYRSQDE